MTWVSKLQQVVERAPWFVGGANVGRFLEAVALVHADAGETLGQGLRFTQPLRCDASALPVLSRDRDVRIYATEPDESKRYRLSRWWQLHRQRGTHQGEMRNLQPYFLTASEMPVIRIVHQDGRGPSGRATWHTLNADGSYRIVKRDPSNFDYDGQDTKHTRFYAVLYAPASMLDLSYYDDGTLYDEDGFYDGIVDTQVALDVIGAILEAKAAHSRLQAFIVATDPTSFDPTTDAVTDPTGWTSLPTGNWGQPIDANGVMTRPPSAAWIYEAGAN